jgi:hypothetical protein
MLYVGPPAHVGHFSDWRLLGLSRCQWNALHLTIGFLFILAMLLHAYYNWRPILNYIKNTKRRFHPFSKPFILSLIITLYISIGTILNWPPMKQILDYSKTVKIAHVRYYGTPPFGPAEDASIEEIVMYMGWDIETSINALRKEKLQINSSKETLKQIANDNGVSLGTIIEIMRKGVEDKTEP